MGNQSKGNPGRGKNSFSRTSGAFGGPNRDPMTIGGKRNRTGKRIAHNSFAMSLVNMFFAKKDAERRRRAFMQSGTVMEKNVSRDNSNRGDK